MTSALDLATKFALLLGTEAGPPTRQDLSAFGQIAAEAVWLFEIEVFFVWPIGVAAKAHGPGSVRRWARWVQMASIWRPPRSEIL